MHFNRQNLEEKVKNTFLEILDIDFIQTDDPNALEGTMKIKPEFSQTMGVLHGGVTIALAESVAGIGSNLMCGEDEKCLGMQISASQVSSAQLTDTVRAKGVLIHKGRTTHVWNVDITSETTGKLISAIRVTNAVLKRSK